ncbi:hypothetical protein [Geoglobus acetivorans]|uniref:Uncharacterized protein n=1 Tax=Geoglobus acetivorans TaxID=565033 RepID=A0A0A7GDL6_GEOAI|nr:hypothetical protein GACE_1106 [Geoglobus acetivorans]
MKFFTFFFGKITIPKSVAEEFGDPIPEWIEVREVENMILLNLLRAKLHKGKLR